MYERLAHLYDNAARDVFTAQANIVTGTEIDRLLDDPEKQNVAGRSSFVVTDLACGTGLLSWLVAGLGPRVLGVDVAEPMLRVATERLAPLGVPALTTPPRFERADITTYIPEFPVDVALCFGDVVNHFLDERDVERLFQTTFSSLVVGGLFILDATMLSTFESELWNSTFEETHDDGTRVVTDVHFDRKEETAIMRFTSTTPSGLEQVEEVHERYYSDAHLLSILREVGFQSIETRVWKPFAVVDENIPLKKTLFIATK